MVYSAGISIAFKDEQGYYKIVESSLFELRNILGKYHKNDLKKQITTGIFTIKCPICGEFHTFSYSLKDFIRKEMIVGGCESTGNPLFSIGKKQNVIRFTQKHNYINQRISAISQ